MATSNDKRIAVVCTFGFPEGLAASTRIISYLKGLNELGVETDVFVYRPTELYGTPDIYPVDGEISGVKYHYPNTRKYSKYRICRAIGRFYYWGVTCWRIYKANKEQKIDYLLISNDFLDILFVFTFWCKFIGVKTAFITDEYPEPIRVYLKDKIPNWKLRMYDFILKRQDSLIFMTDKLNTFFNSKLKKPYHILPTITDTTRFENITKSDNGSKYLCYMGNMELSKDNVDNIIRAFSYIANEYSDLEFHLYGAPSQRDQAFIENVIDTLGMSQRVFIKGRVDSTQVPQILIDAHVLVSSQPNSKRAEGGFPTKLGEYMATGVPTILTDVGEIAQYVQDGKHVHIVPPENPEQYAQKLRYVLDNYAECLDIAKNAKRYLKEQFDYRPISKRLMDFIETRIK